ncbi:WD domain-containing protein, G-beta repeat-containing protein [Nonomuraea maritima]|uniref:WD domain-containing protein, G-beta repeat-containing protein n=1 Tax=Nonomuraea maritima TaxID=683260 RepID=A0A1G8S9U8_9ACTN|nr:serine/threonine-protein kinase [Nonomuraea maritima]SDJ25999.1 WD domain-containing protein, G-beta repeat-containing protein [Nonomuraea maritima]
MPSIRPLYRGEPEQIGGFRLVGALGEGGQGVVYLGESPSGEQVAVKVLHPTRDASVHRRFLREAEIARRVAPFCTARVLSVGLAGDRPFIVSEYISGVSLHDLVVSDGPRRGSGLERLAVITLTALEAIHRAGIVHRDFKPGNVMLGPEGPVVIDFGIAKTDDHHTTRSGAIGTPAYMAPEHIEHNTVSPASDIFGWACTMVFAATGRLAFPGTTVPAVINAVLTREPDLSGVPGHLSPLLSACLSKDPAARPATADALARLTGRQPFPPTKPLTRAASTVPDPSLTARAASAYQDRSLTGHADAVNAVAPGELRGRAVAVSGSSDGTLRVWDLLTGTQVGRPFVGHKDSVEAVAIGELGDGTSIVVSGGFDGTARVWDLATGAPMGKPFAAHTSFVWDVAIGALGNRTVALSAGADMTLRLWDPETGAQIGEPLVGHAGPVNAVTVGWLDGKVVALSGGADNQVRIWDVMTGRPVAWPLPGHTKAVRSVTFGHVGDRPVLLSGSADGTVRVWDLAQAGLIGSLVGHARGVTSVATGTLGEKDIAVTGSEDNTIGVWDLATGLPLGRPLTGHTGAVCDVALHRVEGRAVVLSASRDGTVGLRNLLLP